MILEVQGSLFDAKVDAWVNPVNCVGVMGAGLAREFRDRFPGMMYPYQVACSQGDLQLGKVFTWPTGRLYPKWVIQFPTKQHWREKSKMSSIQLGLVDLRRQMIEKEMESIAIPALGCGLGGLKWSEVKASIHHELQDLDAEIFLYPPYPY